VKHPLHPALVHFPVACWSLATLADLAGLYRTQWPLWQLAGAMLVVGCLAGLAAAAAGLAELLKLSPDSPAAADANRHMLLALVAWSLYAASLLLRLEDRIPREPGVLALAASVAGFLALLAAGWMGGRLVYLHGVGSAAAGRR
jgi:uncharacterized membrane protein